MKFENLNLFMIWIERVKTSDFQIKYVLGFSDRKNSDIEIERVKLHVLRIICFSEKDSLFNTFYFEVYVSRQR